MALKVPRFPNVTRILIVAFLVCAASAQLPRIGDINYYGLRKLTAEQVLAAAHLAPGDSVPAARVEVEDRIADLPDVLAAYVQTVCCEGNRVTLFIGIEERGEAAPIFHALPVGSVTLSADLMKIYREYQGAQLRGQPDPSIARDRERFKTYAATHTLTLRAELRSGPDPEQRAAAATVMAYAAIKVATVDDLLFALQDPDEGVRANAARSLVDIELAARRQPAPGTRIPAARFVDLLNSVVLSDRVESAKALLVLTEKEDAEAIDLIRARALPSLMEMARWTTPSYASPPFRLLGRVAGLPDAEVSQAWDNGDRQPVIQQALNSAAKQPGLQ